jgi:DNA-binding SARP family transcriptional activator
MLDPAIKAAPCVWLGTSGAPALTDAQGHPVDSLRKKDLALLTYLCVERGQVHSRGKLAALLWGDSPEEKSRHSLTQALSRIQRVLGPQSVRTEMDGVQWAGTLRCDVIEMEAVAAGEANADVGVRLPGGSFLAGFNAGRGTQEFELWVDRKQADYRCTAIDLLERLGVRAEEEGDWRWALALGERSTETDPLWEQGHRRMMRAWQNLGERNRALRHFERFEAWLREDMEEEPDPATRQLAEQIRHSQATPPASNRAPLAPESPRTAAPDAATAQPPLATPAAEPVSGHQATPEPRPESTADVPDSSPGPKAQRTPAHGHGRMAGAAVAVSAALLAGVIAAAAIGRDGGPEVVRAISGATLPPRTSTGPACESVPHVARFVGESFPDNVPVRPGETFLKSWTVRNTGTCEWNSSYRLYYEGSTGPRLSLQQRSVPVHGTVPPGATYTFSVPMHAPRRPGIYREDWSLRDGDDALVHVSGSNTVWAKIMVPVPAPAACTADDAVVKFVSESHPDGSPVAPGELFTKTWTIRNSGPCSLPADALLRYVSSSPGRLSLGEERLPLGRAVLPGEMHTLRVEMRAPAASDELREDWMLTTAAGDTIRISGSPTVWIEAVVQPEGGRPTP